MGASTPSQAQQLIVFDYGQLSTREQSACEKDAAKIIEHEKRGLALLVAQGGLLKRVQERLANNKNGAFKKWVEAKMPFNPVTAYSRIRVHDTFADIVQNLNDISLSNGAAEYIAGLVAKDAITDEQMSWIVDEAKQQPVSKARAVALLEGDCEQPEVSYEDKLDRVVDRIRSLANDDHRDILVARLRNLCEELSYDGTE